MVSIKGTYRVQSAYYKEGAKVGYFTFKNKSDGSTCKFAVPFPFHKALVDDALVILDGPIETRMFGNDCTFTFKGSVSAVSEK